MDPDLSLHLNHPNRNPDYCYRNFINHVSNGSLELADEDDDFINIRSGEAKGQLIRR